MSSNLLDKYFELGACSVLLTITVSVIVAETLLRALGQATFSWSLELNLGILVWITWLATAAAIRHSSHLRFTLVRDKLSNNINYVVYWIEWILWILIFTAILRSTYTVLMRRINTGTVISGTEIPLYIMYVSVPFGVSIILFRVIQRVYVLTVAYKNNELKTPNSSIGTHD